MTQGGRLDSYFFSIPIISLWASLSCKNMGFLSEQANWTCFSNTSNWVSGGEKFRLKSSPHSPKATHSIFEQSDSSSVSDSESHNLASCGWIPENIFNFFFSKLGSKVLEFHETDRSAKNIFVVVQKNYESFPCILISIQPNEWKHVSGFRLANWSKAVSWMPLFIISNV